MAGWTRHMVTGAQRDTKGCHQRDRHSGQQCSPLPAQKPTGPSSVCREVLRLSLLTEFRTSIFPPLTGRLVLPASLLSFKDSKSCIIPQTPALFYDDTPEH